MRGRLRRGRRIACGHASSLQRQGSGNHVPAPPDRAERRVAAMPSGATREDPAVVAVYASAPDPLAYGTPKPRDGGDCAGLPVAARKAGRRTGVVEGAAPIRSGSTLTRSTRGVVCRADRESGECPCKRRERVGQTSGTRVKRDRSASRAQERRIDGAVLIDKETGGEGAAARSRFAVRCSAAGRQPRARIAPTETLQSRRRRSAEGVRTCGASGNRDLGGPRLSHIDHARHDPNPALCATPPAGCKRRGPDPLWCGGVRARRSHLRAWHGHGSRRRRGTRLHVLG